MKTISNKSVVAIVLALLVLGLGSSAVVKAGSIFSWLRVEDKVADRIAGKVAVETEEGEVVLGAVVDPYNLPNQLCNSDFCEQYVGETFQDATTTIVSFPSPFLMATTSPNDVVIFTDDGGKKYTSATATVDLARLHITGAATTSFAVGCAAYSGPTFAGQFTTGIVTTSAFGVPTSTLGVIENNLTAANGGLVDGGTTAKIELTPAKPYLLCTVNESVAEGITNGDNTFAGKGLFRIYKTRL